jgi:hypothetical protein
MQTIATIGFDIAKSVFPGPRSCCRREVVTRRQLSVLVYKMLMHA